MNTIIRFMNPLGNTTELYSDPFEEDGLCRKWRRPPPMMREGSHEASVSCAICLESLDHLTIEERTEHYNVHFDEHGPSNSTAHSVPRHSSPGASIAFKAKENVFWHALQEAPPPGNCTPGLIPLLKRTFTKLHSRGITTRAVLCTDGVCHVGTEFFDLGWGCGYRNFLMACTSLVAQQIQPVYFPLLDVGNGSFGNVSGGEPQELRGPGVRALQAWIEEAWRRGFDEEGAKDAHMKGKLVNTKKWIGTTDIYVAFVSRGIPALLVDFPKPQKGRASQSPEHTPATALTRWIVNYFDDVAQPGMEGGRKGNAFDLLKGGGVIVSNRMPIILQHAGHSRTIVGYEKTRSGSINLLLLDPSKRPTGAVRQAALGYHLQMPRYRHHRAGQSNLHSGSSSPRHTPHFAFSASSTSHRLLESFRTLSPGLEKKRQTVSESESVVNNRPVKRVRGAALSGEENEGDLGLDEKLILEEEGFIVLEDQGSARTVSFTDTSRLPRTTGERPSPGAGTTSAEESAADKLCDDLDPLKTANFFRVNIASLSQKDQYQILYFPLTEPLTEYQQLQRMVVRSSIIAPDLHG